MTRALAQKVLWSWATGRRQRTSNSYVASIGTALILAFVILPVLVWPIFGRQGARNVIVWISILLAASLVLLAYPRILSFLVLGFGRLIENSRSERVVRLLGVVLLLSGFHFDLLAS